VSLKKITVILPCYNEEESIPVVLPELLQFREDAIKNRDFADIQVIVVDDGSSDSSSKLLSQFSDVEIISFSENKGYGAALKKGLEVAVGDWVGFYDLDCTCHPMDLLKVKDFLNQDTPAMLCGIRMGQDTGMPRVRQLGNRIFRWVVSLFLGRSVADACSGYRFFHRDYAQVYLQYLPDKLNFTLAMTVFTLRNKMNYKEFNIQYSERAGQSKLSTFKEGVRFFFTILNYRFSPGLKRL
tara:strand:- start:28530 stop:29249 length:720 start_codon:yes stop_codon:yes gene_type:complete